MSRTSRRSRGTATIQDVARHAGVSAMTVSRVVNGVKNVRESTREAVLEAIKHLNYSPNTAARSLAAGEATQIGLLYSNPSAAYLSQFLVGALEAARRAGCHLVIEACESDIAADQAEAAHRFAQTEVEGVVLPPPLSESSVVQKELRAAGTPFVTVGGGKRRADDLNVRIDDFAAAAAITTHLIGLGHRHIGFIRGHPNQKISEDRFRGFCKALKDHGIDPKTVPVEQGYFTYRSGLSAAEKLLSAGNLPSAVFASNDDMAAAAVNVAHRQGLAVPGDLSVVGFDDTAPATTVWPELTTVRQPIAAMAEAAVDILIAHLKAQRTGEPAGPASRVLDYELVIRDSSGPLASTSGPAGERRRARVQA